GEAERDRVDPALERHVEGVDRVFAHAASQQVVGLGLALLTERAQQAAVDEPLMRLVRRDLRLDVPIFRRGSLVDPGMVLLDGRELGGGDRRKELQDDPAILLRHLLDGLDLAHPVKDAPLDAARDRHGDDLLRRGPLARPEYTWAEPCGQAVRPRGVARARRRESDGRGAARRPTSAGPPTREPRSPASRAGRRRRSRAPCGTSSSAPRRPSTGSSRRRRSAPGSGTSSRTRRSGRRRCRSWETPRATPARATPTAT